MGLSLLCELCVLVTLWQGIYLSYDSKFFYHGGSEARRFREGLSLRSTICTVLSANLKSKI